MSEYYQYCGNQHNARRLFNEVKQDPLVQKELVKIEQNVRLNKLTLSDLLVKPMHRITRYPLLFKRLLGHLEPGSEEHCILKVMVAGVEMKIGDVNEIVRQNESAHRIKIIDDNIDFGSIEKFKLCNGRRELMSEKNMTHYKKGMREPVEVTVMMFTDMVLITKMKKPDFFLLLKPPVPFEESVFLDKSDFQSKSFFLFLLTN